MNYRTPFLKECGSMLYWTMLAACTVGPGTVVNCSRAGAEYGLSLTWALIFASILSFTLQEGTARLTIISGKTLGQCLAIKYKHTKNVYNVAVICWVVTVSVYVSNTFFTVNNWAGGIDAVLSIPGASDLTGSSSTLLRVGMCIAYAVVVLLLLWFEKTEKLGIFLGLVMMGMIVLFLIVVVQMGMEWETFGMGFIPNIPAKIEGRAEPTDLILALVGTTSVGFNLFLGGSMAKKKDLVSSQKGIGFSSIAALVVSELILIVGAGTNDSTEGNYSIKRLCEFLSKYAGTGGVTVFAIGFMAAAVSSMITAPLGAAITARSMFFDDELPELESNKENLQNKSRIMSQLMYFTMCIISAVVVATNVDRLVVILLAAVMSGALLPFFAICLLLCINDPRFMSAAPQKGWNNIVMFISVTISLFLASNTIIGRVLGSILPKVYDRVILAAGVSVIGMLVLCASTSLGRDLLKSWRCKQQDVEIEDIETRK